MPNGSALFRIPRPMWMEYLRWYRKVLALPVENGIEVTRSGPKDGLFELETWQGRGASAMLARKVVMATGREAWGSRAFPTSSRRICG